MVRFCTYLITISHWNPCQLGAELLPKWHWFSPQYVPTPASCLNDWNERKMFALFSEFLSSVYFVHSTGEAKRSSTFKLFKRKKSVNGTQLGLWDNYCFWSYSSYSSFFLFWIRGAVSTDCAVNKSHTSLQRGLYLLNSVSYYEGYKYEHN